VRRWSWDSIGRAAARIFGEELLAELSGDFFIHGPE